MNTTEFLQIERLRQQQKSMGVAYLLWIFLGGTGAHRYYCGRSVSAAAMTVLFFASIFGYFGFVVSVFDPNAGQYQVNFYFSTWALCGITLSVWVIVDAFLLCKYIKKHNIDLINSFEAQK